GPPLALEREPAGHRDDSVQERAIRSGLRELSAGRGELLRRRARLQVEDEHQIVRVVEEAVAAVERKAFSREDQLRDLAAGRADEARWPGPGAPQQDRSCRYVG